MTCAPNAFRTGEGLIRLEPGQTSRVLSVLLYLVTAWLIGRRMVTTPIAANDVTPDTWILMGALAINALAGVRLRGALKSQAAAPWLAAALHPTILVLWVGAGA